MTKKSKFVKQITDIIDIYCEHFVKVPMKCKIRLAKDIASIAYPKEDMKGFLVDPDKEPEDINKMVFGPGKDNYGRNTPEWDKELDGEKELQRQKIIEVMQKTADYNLCRKFVNDWLWNPSKYECERKSESFDLDQCRDIACMIESFVKEYAAQLDKYFMSAYNLIYWYKSELRKKEVCPLDDTLVMNMSQVKSLLRTYLPNMQADHILDKMFFKSANKNIKE